MKNQLLLTAIISSALGFVSTGQANLVCNKAASFIKSLPAPLTPEQKEKRIKAAWELSRTGIGELLADTYGMENTMYYILAAMMAKENVLIDGPGGGAKTMGARSAYEAQLNAVRGLSDRSDIDHFKAELLKVLWEDRQQTDPTKQIFTQQFHATLSDTKILGGPDPFKFFNEGKYVIDYSKALISDKNMFAILDELEKAPVALQMTLLSILNERQALAGNQVVQTMLESVAATTNATLGELIGQAQAHEVGGRKAMIDRFAVKVHVVNVSENGDALYFMLEKVRSAKTKKRFTIIDVRTLRPLMDKIQMSQEVLNAMTDISLHMDSYYNTELTKAYNSLQKNDEVPKSAAPFSGSTRSQGKFWNLWRSAFLVRQLMKGVPYSSLDLKFDAKDLVDLVPLLLHGGPDQFVAENNLPVLFYQATGVIPMTNLSSNSENPKYIKNCISKGFYDPHTGIFSYLSTRTHQMRSVYFDYKTKKFQTQDPDIQLELMYDLEDNHDWSESRLFQRYGNLVKTLTQIHESLENGTRTAPQLRYKLTGRLSEFVNGNDAPLRNSAKLQLKEIMEAHNALLEVLNPKLEALAGKPRTPVNVDDLIAYEKQIDETSAKTRAQLKAALTSNNQQLIEEVAATALLNASRELKFRFIEAESNVQALLKNIFLRKNIMLFGGPGSGKTLLARTVLNAELEFISEAQIARTSSILSKVLLENNVSPSSLWIKQFHPMSNEGDIVGRIDLKAVREGQGYVYNRTGSMSAKDVLFALLDEFEKAPPGVKTALLSLLNERKLMDGDMVVDSSLIAVVINTNATPGQFITGLGDFSTAFPIYDRVHTKAYSLNKLTDVGLREFHRRIFAGLKMALKNPLFIHPLPSLAATYHLQPAELRLISHIHQAFLKSGVDKSETERVMYAADADGYRDFFMNTRGESGRSSISTVLEELPGAVTFEKLTRDNKPLRPSELRRNGNSFDLDDLLAYANLVLCYNPYYKIGYDTSNGMIQFKMITSAIESVENRLDPAEKKFKEHLKAEHESLVVILNNHVQKFVNDQRDLIRKNPKLYPSLFATEADRQAWARLAGGEE